MMIALLALLAALQSQTPAPVVQVAPPSPAEPASAPAATPASAPDEVVAEAPEPGAEPVAGQARTRQACRFVEVPGRRFPVRRCRTIQVQD